ATSSAGTRSRPRRRRPRLLPSRLHPPCRRARRHPDHLARPGALQQGMTMTTAMHNAAGVLRTPFTLPGGATLKNRLVKASMSEQLASPTGAPTEALERLYARWARGGAGLLITGNVMIDQRSIGEPRNVVVEDDRDLAALRRWAAAATAHGTTAIVQLNHPGRQSPKGL